MALENVIGAASVKTEISQAVATPVTAAENVQAVQTTSQSAKNTVSADAQQGEMEEAVFRMAKNTVKSTVTKTNSLLGKARCDFSYHEGTHSVSIKFIDKETGEVLKEIPPEKSLEMLQKMWEMAGILVDERR